MDHNEQSSLALPVSIVSRVDISRVLREVEVLNDFLDQSKIRQPGTQAKMPRTSRLLDEVVQANDTNILKENERRRLYEYLKEVRDRAPALHMSFSSDPSPIFVKRLVTWLRDEIHPMVLVQVGLQPNIGAGCVVRTTNKYFDLSLRNRLSDSRDILLRKLRSVENESPPAGRPVSPQQAVAATTPQANSEVPA